MTTINVALLNKALDAIVADPTSWSQKFFACNTTMCLAGHILIQSGEYTMKDNAFFSLDEDELVDPEEVGQQLLGLAAAEAYELFFLMPGNYTWDNLGLNDDEGKPDPVAFAAHVRSYLLGV